MNLFLDRIYRTEKSTIGKLYVDGTFQCFILEDADRGLKQNQMALEEIQKRKLKGVTCIPSGNYDIIINMSTRFKRLLPLLVNVPGYSGIRIHPGNTAENTEGCLLPGEGRAADAVINSRKAFDALFTRMQLAFDSGEKITIEIN